MYLLFAAARAAVPGMRQDLDAARAIEATVELWVDPAREEFSGHEQLLLEIGRPTRAVWVNATDLQITEVQASAGGSARLIPGNEDWVGIELERVVRGPLTLDLSWTGRASSTETRGLFRQNAGDDWYLFSQFQTRDSRRVFPSIDQPDNRVRWNLSLHLPDGLGAYANMPVAEIVDLAGPTHRVRFAETRPLPSYLLALAVGPFDEVAGGVGGVNRTPVRILTPRGRSGDAQFAATQTAEILSHTEAWFDIPYPFPKLDIVALPLAVGFGAMENPGLITCLEDVTLARPENDTITRQRTYVRYMSHEIAHMWFGDMVTLRWWDDLWLNESFASWLSQKTVADLHPDWDEDVQAVMSRNDAMQVDALSTGGAIRRPIRSWDDVEAAFDPIIYNKGQSILEMLENWVGPIEFRNAVRAYVRTFSFGNADTNDFLATFGRVAGISVGAAFKTFLDQSGVPRVDVALVNDGLSITQRPYLPQGGRSTRRKWWLVPVCIRWADEMGEKSRCTLLNRRQDWFPLGSAPNWVLPNVGMGGYYRMGIDERLIGLLLDPSTPLTVPERVGVLGDTRALEASGDLDPSVLLSRLPELIAIDDPWILDRALVAVADLEPDLVPDDRRANYQRMIVGLFGATASELGYFGRDGEDEATRIVRPKVLALVGGSGGEPRLVAEAKLLTEQWLQGRTGVDPDVLDAALAIAARHGDAALFDRMEGELLTEPDPVKRGHILLAMSEFRHPDLAIRAVALGTSGRVDPREAFSSTISAAGHPESRVAVWRNTQAHIDEFAHAWPSDARRYLPHLAISFCDPALRAEAGALFTPRVGGWVGAPPVLAQVLEVVDLCVARVALRQADVRAVLDRW